jgi:PPP family 3-phenylpropionic acid transporter
LTGTVSLNTRQRDQVPAAAASFIVLYALLYGAFGAASPFLPAFIEERGIPPELIGILFGAGTAIRLVSAPVAGRIADRTHALRLTLAVCAVGTALAVMSYLPAASFWPLLAVSLLHAAALAPTTNLADALALVASRQGRPLGFEYGWVRGAGSAAFIVASIIDATGGARRKSRSIEGKVAPICPWARARPCDRHTVSPRGAPERYARLTRYC